MKKKDQQMFGFIHMFDNDLPFWKILQNTKQKKRKLKLQYQFAGFQLW